MTNPKHTDTSRSGDLVDEMRDLANAFGDDVKRRYSQDLLREAADRIEALEAENEALRALQEGDGELLTIAWMDGAHRSNKAHREQVAALKAEIERLTATLSQLNDTDIVARTMAENERLTAWRNAVIDELTVLHIYNVEHDADPRKAVRDIVEWNQRLALDPAVSAEARALMVRGGEMVKEAAAQDAETWFPFDTNKRYPSFGVVVSIRALSVPAIVEAGDGDL